MGVRIYFKCLHVLNAMHFHNNSGLWDLDGNVCLYVFCQIIALNRCVYLSINVLLTFYNIVNVKQTFISYTVGVLTLDIIDIVK